jgi:2-haloacid dehalogenase
MHRRDLLLALAAVPLRTADFGLRNAFGSTIQSAPGSPSDIRAIVFDAYGTLFDVHSVIALADEIFPGRGDALSQQWRAKQLEYSWTLSLMGRYEDFWSVTDHALVFACRALKLTCTPAQHDRLMDSYLRLSPFPDVPTGLKDLSGYALAILSNGSPKMLSAVVASARLDGSFKQVISVDRIRIYKPSPRVYQLAVDALKVPAASILFVSSNLWDAEGAKAFGLRTCWINRTGAPADDLKLTPDIVITALTELPARLRAR